MNDYIMHYIIRSDDVVSWFIGSQENSACAALLQRIHALEEQQLTGQGLLCGPLLGSKQWDDRII